MKRRTVVMVATGSICLIAILILCYYFDIVPRFGSNHETSLTKARESPDIDVIDLSGEVHSDDDGFGQESDVVDAIAYDDVWSVCEVDDLPELYDEETAAKVLNTGQCRQVFEHYIRFKELTFYSSGFLQFIELNEPLTFARIFADPVGDRERVLDTLSKPLCRAVAGGEPRWDLKNACDADALTNFVYFSNLCREEDTPILALEWSSTILNRDTSSFRIESGSEWKSWLARDWVVEQCSKFDIDQIVLDDERDISVYSDIASLRALILAAEDDEALKKLNASSQNSGQWQIAAETLMALAARLGNTWATIHYSVVLDDNSWRSFLSEKLPWLHSGWNSIHPIHLNPYDEKSDWITFEHTFESKFTQDANKLKRSLTFILDLEDAGLEVRWRELVQEICKEVDDCVNTVKYLKERNQFDFRRLRALDQIELHSGLNERD